MKPLFLARVLGARRWPIWQYLAPVHIPSGVSRPHWSGKQNGTTSRDDKTPRKSRPRVGYASPFNDKNLDIGSASPIKEMDLQEMDMRSRYRLLCSSIVPRPIAFVSTCSTDGVYNLAAFSFFMPVTADPPSIAFSITR